MGRTGCDRHGFCSQQQLQGSSTVVKYCFCSSEKDPGAIIQGLVKVGTAKAIRQQYSNHEGESVDVYSRVQEFCKLPKLFYLREPQQSFQVNKSCKFLEQQFLDI